MAHQSVGLATLGRNSASLEGHGTALTTLRLARGMVKDQMATREGGSE
jgi:hypothetical protein